MDRSGGTVRIHGPGKPVPDALESVLHHLTRCGECREEYEALLTALIRLQEREGS
jgi:predicted anti-sigma-YlaC factor YlaD